MLHDQRPSGSAGESFLRGDGATAAKGHSSASRRPAECSGRADVSRVGTAEAPVVGAGSVGEGGANGASAGAPASGSASPSALTPQGHGHVLVVDDEPSVARLTGLVLNQQGFDVEVAVSGRQALEMIQSLPGRFRLILVDLSMPDLSGVEVLQQARALGCPAPVVLTSGYSRTETAQVVGSAEFAGYLQKPYRLEALLEVIDSALAG